MATEEDLKRSHIAVLLMLAEADDRDHLNEDRFINYVASKLGLSESDVVEIDRHPENWVFEFPKSEKDRMNILYHMLFLMKIDGAVANEEKTLCHELGLRLGFNQMMVNELIIVMDRYAGRTIPEDTLLNIIKKYMN
ncbi:MAG: hypothetical protein ACR2MX_09770 [Cyclobacteriaceae bacterium]